MHAQPEPTDRAEVQKLARAVEEALAGEMPTSVRIERPDVPSWQDGPRIGTTPPVAQPGIPPMGQQATDIGRAALYCSLATVPPGLIAIGIMVASQHADPTVIGMICAAPAALAVPILAIARLIRGAQPEPDIHHHYNGNVDQRHVHTTTRGVWAKTNNQQ
jgi:hypothetical protein